MFLFSFYFSFAFFVLFFVSFVSFVTSVSNLRWFYEKKTKQNKKRINGFIFLCQEKQNTQLTDLSIARMNRNAEWQSTSLWDSLLPPFFFRFWSFQHVQCSKHIFHTRHNPGIIYASCSCQVLVFRGKMCVGYKDFQKYTEIMRQNWVVCFHEKHAKGVFQFVKFLLSIWYVYSPFWKRLCWKINRAFK